MFVFCFLFCFVSLLLLLLLLLLLSSLFTHCSIIHVYRAGAKNLAPYGYCNSYGV